MFIILLFIINLLLYSIQLYTLRFIVISYYLLYIYENVIEVKHFNFEILKYCLLPNTIKINKIIK